MATRNKVCTCLQSIWARMVGRFGNIWSWIDVLSCFVCFKRHSMKEGRCVFQLQLAVISWESRSKIWHDATVICVHPDGSLEHSSSQQPTWKSPIPARPSKRMRMIWLVWRLMAKHMNRWPKGGSFIFKHPHVGTIPSFFEPLSNTSTSAFSRNPHALLRKQCQGPKSTLATTQWNAMINNGGI